MCQTQEGRHLCKDLENRMTEQNWSQGVLTVEGNGPVYRGNRTQLRIQSLRGMSLTNEGPWTHAKDRHGLLAFLHPLLRTLLWPEHRPFGVAPIWSTRETFGTYIMLGTKWVMHPLANLFNPNLWGSKHPILQIEKPSQFSRHKGSWMDLNLVFNFVSNICFLSTNFRDFILR